MHQPTEAINLSPFVYNQKEEGICEILATTDMVSASLRRNGILGPNEVLSPQVLRDSKATSETKLKNAFRLREKGLETLDVYAYIPVTRTIRLWIEGCYQTEMNQRFRVQDIRGFYEPEDIRDLLVGMFSEGGFGYPCVGILRMGRLMDPEVARQCGTGESPPYRHPVVPLNQSHAGRLYGSKHSVLIVGVTENYCIIKNTHGKKWGDFGYSRVSFDMFEIVYYVVQEDGGKTYEERLRETERKRKRNA